MQIIGQLWIMASLATFSRQAAAWTMRVPARAATRSLTTLKSSATDEATTVNGRLSRNNLNLEVKTIVSDIDLVLSHLKSRRASEETIEAAKTISSLQSQRVALIQERDDFLNRRKEASAMVGKLMQNKDTAGVDVVEEQKAISAQAAEGAQKAEEELEKIQSTMDGLLAGIPNLLDDCVPDGDNDTQNKVVSKWGDVDALPKMLELTEDFKPKWHDDVALGLNGYKAEEAVKMSGARFVALSGSIARLERALAMFFLDLHTTKHGYTEVSVPFIVGRSALEGTSQLPKFQEDLFAITPASHTCNGEDAFLIPTAEVPLTNMHADSIMEEADLPISYVAYTPCFRAEAGSYGRDTKGLIRTHQFQKVEMVKITSATNSDEHHEALTGHAEACLQALELPYRKVRLCSGDIGFSARHCYDLEVWLPGAQEYREISSCSNTGDFQARRMGLRYRPSAPAAEDGDGAGGKKKTPKKLKPEFCHTINGSGLAVGRTLVAVLENYQTPDGSVVVPEVLRPYMGGATILQFPSK
jgi:seryl-tRNA synthetase